MDFLRKGLHTITNVNVAGGKRKSSFFFLPKRSLFRVPSLKKITPHNMFVEQDGEKTLKLSSFRSRETAFRLTDVYCLWSMWW